MWFIIFFAGLLIRPSKTEPSNCCWSSRKSIPTKHRWFVSSRKCKFKRTNRSRRRYGGWCGEIVDKRVTTLDSVMTGPKVQTTGFATRPSWQIGRTVVDRSLWFYWSFFMAKRRVTFSSFFGPQISSELSWAKLKSCLRIFNHTCTCCAWSVFRRKVCWVNIKVQFE